MAKFYVAHEKDRKTLKVIADHFKRTPPSLLPPTAVESLKAPDSYLAVCSEAIPALTEEGEGESHKYILGVGSAQFCSIFSDVTPVVGTLNMQTQRVYNFTGAAIPADTVFQVMRLKSGQYVAVSGGTSIAFAQLDEDLDAGSTAEATFKIGGTGTVEVKDRLLGAFETLEEDTWVVIALIAGEWYVINASCAPLIVEEKE